MAATALIKFTQGLVVGADGQALLGVSGASVHVSNVVNTDVQSWQVDLVYVDPRSSLVAADAYATGNNSTPSADFTPDSSGSYRVVLKVWENPSRTGDPVSVDIRVFSILEEFGLLVPPSQVWPLPLPDPRSGLATARPGEMNFAAQLHGWAGNGTDGLLNEAVRRVDSSGAVKTLPFPRVHTTSSAPSVLATLSTALWPAPAVLSICYEVLFRNDDASVVCVQKWEGTVAITSTGVVLVSEKNPLTVPGAVEGPGELAFLELSIVGSSVVLTGTPGVGLTASCWWTVVAKLVVG